LSLEEPASLVPKLREMEEQGRINHMLILARFMRMKLEGRDVAPVEALPETLRNIRNPPRKEE